MMISFKSNYTPYKIEKVIVWINNFLCLYTNLIIYIIVTEFLNY